MTTGGQRTINSKSRRVRAADEGLKPHYKVRIVLPGAILHLASWNVPTVDASRQVAADWIDDPGYG